MSDIKKVPITLNSVGTPVFFCFNLLRVYQYIAEASVAFRSVRSLSAFNEDIGKPRKIKDIGFASVSSDSFTFIDSQGEPLQYPADGFFEIDPELRISIPDNDKCFHIFFEWFNQETCEKAQAEYICSRQEAGIIQQRNRAT